MASPLLHIKDSYYFDVPRFLWRPYQDLDAVPKWLRENHQHATLDEFNHDLAGKLIIPQPFGTPLNLYQKKDGFLISRFMVIEVVVAVLLIAVFTAVARRLRQGGPPRGKLWNFFESILLYIRNEVVEPAIGHHDAHKFAPLLWTVFFFVLFCNLMGLVPWAGATSM